MRWLVITVVGACSFTPGIPPTGGGADDARLIDSVGSGSADAGATCTDGVKNGNELDVDCGGSCAKCTKIFSADANTLAVLELNGNVSDTSGNNRDASLVGGSFVPTSWGMGLSLPGQTGQGMVWGFASLIDHPYTVEIVVIPESVSCWKKLVGYANSIENGWYYCGQFQSYPSNPIGPTLPANQRHYLAMVSTAGNQIDVYFNGAKIGSTQTFTVSTTSLILFRDDTVTNSEHLRGIVDGVRISSVARGQAEITAVQTRLAAQL